MNFKKYFYEKLPYCIFWLLFLIFLFFMLSALSVNVQGIIYLELIIVIFNSFMLAYEYIKKAEYYNNFKKSLESLDKKYLVTEIINKPNFYEGQILYNSLTVIDKSMNDNVAIYRRSVNEYKEFIETWVHEIKTPIASSKLIVQNNKNEITLDIDQELDKIDNLVEQVLYYSKINDVQKDYYISKVYLKDIVTSFLKANYKLFLNYNVSVNIDALDSNVIIYTDKKWINYIISQIISNSIKYKTKNIKIYSKEGKNKCSLFIKDNGIGIQSSDISRVFEKGFTGVNGRKYTKSTGMGLYLCKKLCNKLGIGLYIKSKVGKFTTLEIVFPKSNIYKIQ